jgi:hypothetical protein
MNPSFEGSVSAIVAWYRKYRDAMDEFAVGSKLLDPGYDAGASPYGRGPSSAAAPGRPPAALYNLDGGDHESLERLLEGGLYVVQRVEEYHAPALVHFFGSRNRVFEAIDFLAGQLFQQGYTEEGVKVETNAGLLGHYRHFQEMRGIIIRGEEAMQGRSYANAVALRRILKKGPPRRVAQAIEEGLWKFWGSRHPENEDAFFDAVSECVRIRKKREKGMEGIYRDRLSGLLARTGKSAGRDDLAAYADLAGKMADDYPHALRENREMILASQRKLADAWGMIPLAELGSGDYDDVLYAAGRVSELLEEGTPASAQDVKTGIEEIGRRV